MSLRPPKVGVLPLYLALYEEAGPELRLDMETFARLVVERLQAQGLEVVLTRTCWFRQQVEAQVAALTAAEVDLLATLHLSYSPSLEAVEALQAAPLPLLLLDTTPNPRFADLNRGLETHWFQILRRWARSVWARRRRATKPPADPQHHSVPHGTKGLRPA